MSGLGGHLQNLYEDKNLFFGDIKEIIKRAANNSLENVSEKIDGQNIFIIRNSSGEIRGARNKEELNKGGLNSAEILQKFSSHNETVRDAFFIGLSIIQKAFAALNEETLQQIFRKNESFSAEIIYSKNPNVINYEKNIIVFHRKNPITQNFNQLLQNINKMQLKVQPDGWLITGPVMPILGKTNEGIVEKAISKINEIQELYKISDNDTINKFIEIRLNKDVVSQLPIDTTTSKALTEKLAYDTNNQILFKAALRPKIDILFENRDQLLTEALRPLESIINNFGAELLVNAKSGLGTDSQKTIQGIKEKIKNKINNILSTGSKEDKEKISKQFGRLVETNKLVSSIEGIVFTYKNKFYKLSGSFPSINQILAIQKY